MQCTVTVVNLIHDTATETDTPVCWPFPACSWRECRSTSGSGTAKDPERTIHVRIPANLCTTGYLQASVSFYPMEAGILPETLCE